MLATDVEGLVVITEIPVDVAHVARVFARHVRYGDIEEEFQIPPHSKSELALSVSGKGMVIAKLRAADPARRVVNPQMVWRHNGSFEGSTSGEGEQSELRTYVGMGSDPIDFEFSADGFEKVTVAGVRMRGDGPTKVEVRFP